GSGRKSHGPPGDRDHPVVLLDEALTMADVAMPPKLPVKPPVKPREPARNSLVTETEPRSAAAEAYRTLRTNIRFAGLDSPCRTIVITSASPGEGKTTTVANFGIAAAQADARV